MDRVNARIVHKSDTTANWNLVRSFIPLKGEIIIYTDYGHIDDGSGNQINVPKIKIGDGSTYLIDLPFIGDDQQYAILKELQEHTNDWSVHVASEDREFWNDKLNCFLDHETLIFNRS